MSMGTSARSVSLTSMRSMKKSANNPPVIVFARYMTAGPTAVRTALRSFVRRAMMSPVRVCAKYAVSSVSRCVKRSFRRSYSIQRLTPFISSRIPYLKAPPTIAASTMKPASFQIVLRGAPALIASMARRRSQGITLVIADDATTISSPIVKGIQYGL